MTRLLATAALASTLAVAADAQDAQDAPDTRAHKAPAASDNTRTVKQRKQAVDRSNLLVVGPTFLPLGVNARYQRMLVPHLSAFVGGGIGGSDYTIEGEDIHLSAKKGLVGFDVHTGKKGMRGLYLGPRLEYRNWTALSNEYAVGGSVTSVAIEGIVGWRFVGKKGMSIGVGVGAGYVSRVGEALVVTDIPLTNGIEPRGDINLGWAF